MKGYGIYVKNDLLDKKHFDTFGTSPLWLYLWLLDKMTSVDENGTGKVLGGKPIKYDEIKKELGLSERSYNRYTKLLRDNNYIVTTKTMYGLIFVVNKATKIFGSKRDTPKLATPDTPKSVKRTAKVAEPIRQSGGTNKTIQYNNTKTIQVAKATKQSFGNEDINAILDVFKGLPLTQIKRQRQSAHNLVRRHGFEKALRLAKYSLEIQSDRYSPTTHDVISLWDNQTKLVAYWNKHNNQVIDIGE